MMEDRTDSAHFKDEPEPQLTSPRFDENAAANAQPVQPIRVGRVAFFGRQVGSVWRAIGVKSRTLAVVVIAGLAIGTLGTISLVRHRQESSESPAVNESVSVLPGATTEGEESSAAAIEGSDLLSISPTSTRATTRVRKNRKRVRAGRVRDGSPRAYRVAVIR